MSRAEGSFELHGLNGYLKVTVEEVFGFPDQTSVFGGYDVRGSVEIRSEGYSAHGQLWFSTGEVYTFYQQLMKGYEQFSGEAEFSTTEHNLEFQITFNRQGHVYCKGTYTEQADSANILIFEFRSDQSFIKPAIDELVVFVQQYGGLTGIRAQG